MLPPVYTALKEDTSVSAIVGNRIYRHGNAPQDVTRPYVTWFLVTGTPENTLCDRPDVDRMTLQIDCWHQTDAGIELLADSVRDALEPFGHVTGIVINERDQETKLYRIGIQMDWWLNR